VKKKLPNNQQEYQYCRPTTPILFEEGQTRITSMNQDTQTKCPHPACPYSTNKRDRMRRHFRARHPNDVIVIEEEGLLPQCPQCGLYQQNAHTNQHTKSKECIQYTEVKKKRQQEVLQNAATHVRFYIDNQPVAKTTKFKYLGRIITDEDEDLPAVERQITKARTTWRRIGKIIQKKTDSNPKVMATFYKAIIQSILLYGAESWTASTTIISKLNAFQHRCARHMVGKHIKLTKEGEWIYPSSKSTLDAAGLLTIKEYITKRKNTVSEYIKNTTIFNECKTTILSLQNSTQIVWWQTEKIEENKSDENE
jgi:hypothetical protein